MPPDLEPLPERIPQPVALGHLAAPYNLWLNRAPVEKAQWTLPARSVIPAAARGC
jgi:hypothetical protein